MHNRLLGKTELSVSEVGLGAWQLGADWGDPVSEETAFDILRTAVDNGVNFIDTADVYGAGRSETLIGSFIKTHEANIAIATKQGRFEGWDDSYETMKAHAVASLKRLGTETLDLLQLHCIPFATLQKGEVFSNLEKLQREGIIRFAGVSVESVEEGLFCIKQPIVSALQVIYNAFRQKLTTELLPQAKQANVGILARVPLASGLLAGKFTANHRFSENDHRHYNANGQCFNVGETFAGVPFPKGVQFASQFADIVAEGEQSLAQKALRWVLDNDAVSTVIPGATKTQQTAGNCAASQMASLSPATHQQLRELYENQIKDAIRGPY